MNNANDFVIENGVLKKYIGSDADITIPDGVTEIGDYAFYDCSSLGSVVIPNGVTEIGYEAFYGCSSLSSIVIPKSVREIGISAFSYCKKLIIYAPKGSYAEKYAIINEKKFTAI